MIAADPHDAVAVMAAAAGLDQMPGNMGGLLGAAAMGREKAGQ